MSKEDDVKKKSRKQRKEATVRCRSRHARAAMAVVAACAIVVVTNTASADNAQRHIADPLPRVEREEASLPRYTPFIAAAIATARRLDAVRALDWRLREIYRSWQVSWIQIQRLRGCITAGDFAHEVCSWRPAAQWRIREIDGIAMISRDGRPTLELEELWENGFRRRMRREGALQRVLDGTIRSAPIEVAKAA